LDGSKQKVAQLVSDAGLRAIDVGSLCRARQLEQLGFLHIRFSSRAISASAARSSCIRKKAELPGLLEITRGLLARCCVSGLSLRFNQARRSVRRRVGVVVAGRMVMELKGLAGQ